MLLVETVILFAILFINTNAVFGAGCGGAAAAADDHNNNNNNNRNKTPFS
jgi:hypothetical protein